VPRAVSGSVVGVGWVWLVYSIDPWPGASPAVTAAPWLLSVAAALPIWRRAGENTSAGKGGRFSTRLASAGGADGLTAGDDTACWLAWACVGG